MTVWTVGHRRGIRYDIDADGHVAGIQVGTKAIEYIEGCL